MLRENGSLRVDQDRSIWAERFMVASVVQGAVVVGLTIFLILGQASVIKPEVSRVMAGGGAGTWFTVGFVMYIVVGVLGVAVSALFYQYLEAIGATKLQKGARMLAWIHLVLMNVGATVAMGLMMYAGYVGGASMLPQAVGGLGLSATQAHEIMGPFVEPISAAVMVMIIGILAGGISFLLAYRSSPTLPEEKVTVKK